MAETVTVRKPTEQVIVPFAGAGEGEGEMSWGQWEIWLAMVSQRSHLPIGGTQPLPDGTTVADIAEDLKFTISRYPSMRTRLRFTESGRPLQILSASGEIALDVFDAVDADPADVAADVETEYRERPYDYEREWPVRMAVVRTTGDLVTHRVVIMHHLVTDAAGGAVMVAEIVRGETGPVPEMQALQQAEWQRSPAGIRQSEAAMRHWGTVLRSIPLRRLTGSDDPRQPRAWVGTFRSPAMRTAVQAIAVRTGADSSAVLLALFAVALARQNGINPVMTRPVVSNRFRPGLRDVVGMIGQNGICALDVAGVTLDEVIARSARAVMAAYKHAYFDPERLAALIADVKAERGPDFDVRCYFNDRRVGSRGFDGEADLGKMRAALGDTSFAWTKKQEDVIEHLFVHIDDVPDTLQITLDIDTHMVSPADGEALVFGIETVAIEAATDGSAPTAVPICTPAI